MRFDVRARPRTVAPLLTALVLVGCGVSEIASGDDDEAATSSSAKFAGGFTPSHAPYGGFGGASRCTASRTPVVFLHGNGEGTADWFRPASDGGPSVPARFAAAGYRGCELFGVTWLSSAARAQRTMNTHDAGKADLVAGFVADVLRYTGAARVDLVGHSMGVTVGLHAADRGQLWGRLRRFVSIAGGLRGLDSCLPWGTANPLLPACWAQAVYDPDLFGFYPAFNPRLEAGGFRARPAQHPNVQFASIRAGASDEILCPSCGSALFDAAPNLVAQLDVGVGRPAEGDHDDTSGVGHLRARRDTGVIQVNLLTTSCAGAACCAGYTGRCGD